MNLVGDNDAKQIGDIAIYRDENEAAVHSATVSEIDKKGSVVTVSGLGGLQIKSHTDPPEKQYPLKYEKIEYYRRSKDDRTDAERKEDVERIKRFERRIR